MGNKRNPDDSGYFGPTIHTYTRAQAIDDGTLVDLHKVAPDVCSQHFKFPIAMTAAAFGIVQRAVESKEHVNDYNGVIHDVLWMSIKAGRDLDPTTRLFQVIITGAGPQDLHELKIMCGPGDSAEPVLTIMLPDED